MAAHQAPPSLGFSRQEHWSGLPFPSPMHESESDVAQSCRTPSDPMNCSLPGSSVHGICQARVLEWVDENVLKLTMVIVVYLCEYTKKHWIVYCKSVNFMAWELYFKKGVFFKCYWRKNYRNGQCNTLSAHRMLRTQALCVSVAKNDAETGQARAGQI